MQQVKSKYAEGTLMMGTIGLIDYGAENYSSVRNALVYLRLDFREVRQRQQFDLVSHLILPGVGTFRSVMRELENLQLKEAFQTAWTLCHKVS